MENGTLHADTAIPEALENVQAQLEAAKEKLSGVDKKVRAFVKERPGMVLLGAVAVGFLFGRLVSRR